MAFAPPTKTLVFLQLFALLLSLFAVNAAELNLSPAESPKPHGHHHNLHPVHPPVQAPVHSPAKAPVHDHHHHHHNLHPAHPPVNAPVHPPVKAPSASPVPFLRKFLAVEGFVYCKSCKYHGIDTFLGATPLVGSKVKLVCNSTKYRPVTATAITDKNGHFIINPKGVKPAAYHKCKVYLLSSPSATCNVPTSIHNGTTGATLKPIVRKQPPVVASVTTPGSSSSSGSGSSLDHHAVRFFTVGPFAYEPSKKYPCPK